MVNWWLQAQAEDTPAGGNPGTAEAAADDEVAADAGGAGATPAADGAAAVPASDAGVPAVADDAQPATPLEVHLVPDATESLGSVAETLHETLVGDQINGETGGGLFGVSGLEWGLGLGAMVVALALRLVVLWLMKRYLRPLVEKTETEYDDKLLNQLRRAVGIFILLGGFFLAFTFIQLPEVAQAVVWRVLHTLIIISVGLLLYRIVEIFLHLASHSGKDQAKSVLDEQLFPLTRDIVKFVAIILVIIAVVQSWGYNASGLLAGVGLGGLALAFAAQDTVANIFGSFMIFADKPYKVGDWVKYGGVEGTVEEIGVRTTRIRCFDKTVVTVPNKTITNDNIQNFSAMPIRRIKLFVGLSYEASVDQIRQVVEDTRAMLAGHPAIDQNFWMVNFTEMSTSSLDMLVYAFTRTTIWKDYMDIRQDVLLRIIQICKENKVDIAFPSRTIYHKNADVHPSAGFPDALRRGVDEDLPPQLRREEGPPDQRAEFDTAEGEGESV